MAFVLKKTKTNLALISALKHITQNIAALLVPPACPVCHGETAADEGLCTSCWQGLDFIRPPLCAISGQPLSIDLGPDSVALPVQINPPPYDKARAAFIYKGSAAALIKRMKFGDRPELAHWLAGFMALAGDELLTHGALLVPVPLHRRHLFSRRFNQAAELCRALARLTGHEVGYEAVQRIKPTRQQIGLTRAGRKRNLAGAFFVPHKMRGDIKGRTLVLIDDVLTTGATVEALARLLKRHGAAHVYVLTLARVVMGEQVTIFEPRSLHDNETGLHTNDQRPRPGRQSAGH